MAQRYSQMLDWGLRLVLLLAVPCAVGLLAFAQPLVATLFHRGALHGQRCAANCPGLGGLRRGAAGAGGHQGAGTGLLCQPGHAHPREDCPGGAGAHPGAQRRSGAALAACRPGLVDWSGSAGQCAVAAGGAAAPGRLPAQPRLVQVLGAGAGWLRACWQPGCCGWPRHWDWLALRQNWQRTAAMLASLGTVPCSYFGVLLLSGVKIRSLLRR